ncbi:MAG: FHA domain-containing protein [Myxococcota bacterium]
MSATLAVSAGDLGSAAVLKKLGKPERVAVAISDELVADGWFGSRAWETLLSRRAAGEVELLAVQVGLAPCALVPDDVPLVQEAHAERSIGAWSAMGPRPRAARYEPGQDAAERERIAARLTMGDASVEVPQGLEPGAYVDGRFRVLGALGSDAAFAYWSAEDRAAGRAAVLAALHPHVRGSAPELLAACAGWSKLEHPGVAELLASGTLPDGRAWYAREQVSEHDLMAVLEGASVDRLLLALLDVTEGLAFAHESGVVHGGLEPERVLVRADGSAAVGGFGLAKLEAVAPAVLFAAPESLEPGAKLQITHDVYGLGMLALLAFHGAPLPYWVLRDAQRLLTQLALPEPLGSVVAACVSWDPSMRPTSVGTVREALLADTARLRSLVRQALDDGRDTRAEDLLDLLEKRPDAGPETEALRVRLARTRASQGDPRAAVVALTELASSASDAASLWLEIAQIQQANGMEGVVDSWERALETHGTRAEAVAALRGLASLDGDRFLRWGRALALYADADERGPLAWRLGRAFHEAGSDSSALLWLDRAADEGVDDPELFALREKLRTARGDWGDVVELMKRQAVAGPGPSIELLERAARLARRATPDIDAVAELYAKLVELDPEHAEARRHLARHALRSQDVPGALAHFAVLCGTSRATAADHAARARLAIELGDLDTASASATEALALEPHHVPALRVARRASQELGAFEAAVGHQRRFVEVNASTEGSAHADRLVHLGHLLRFAGHTDEAVEAYDEAIAYTPLHLEAWWGLYVIERAQLGASAGPPAPLRFGPHEGLARLLAELVEPGGARKALSTDRFGAALAERADWERPSSWAAAVVDVLSYRSAIGPQLFDRLLDAFPERVPHIAVVRNLWSGGAHHTASFPIASASSWSDDGPDFDPELQRELVFCRSWPSEAEWAEDAFLTPLFARETPLVELDDLDVDEDEDLLLEAPEIPMLVVGSGLGVTRHEIEASRVITPALAPGLPGDLLASKHGDRIYLSVERGVLEREGVRAAEFRMRGGDRLDWDGVPITFLRVQDRQAFTQPDPSEIDHADEETEHTGESESMSDSIEALFAPMSAPLPGRPVDELDAAGAALLWEDGDEQVGISLERPEVFVIELPDGRIAFSGEEQEDTLAAILQRAGMHYIEQDLSNASGFVGRLSARQLYSDEVVMFGSRAFQYRAARAPTGTPLEMPRPSLGPLRPTLILQDGSLVGRPVPVASESFRIGRGGSCELQIRTDGLLSRVHCVIREIDGQFVLEDAGSSNGTRLNGKPVDGPLQLDDGDMIEIGHTSLQFTRTPPLRPLIPTSALEDDALPEDSEMPAGSGEGTTLVVDPAEVDFAIRAASAEWTEGECLEKVRVANRAFRVLFNALDAELGPGSGQATLQLLVSANPREHAGLLKGLELDEAALPGPFFVTAMQARAEPERRRLLNKVLLDLIDRATDRVCEQLPESRVDAVLSRMAAIGHRRQLRA